MFENLNTLEDLCLDTICDNILTYIETQIKTRDGDWKKLASLDDYDDEIEKRYVLRDPDIFLINEISEKLLKKLVEKGLLCDATLSIFTGRNTKLKHVKLKNCKVSKKGLNILKQHKIVDLECISLKNNVNISQILDCLNEWSVRNMISANFSKCSFIDMYRHSYMVEITNLKNLRSLNLSYTELNQTIFKIICDDLKHLEKLDVSGTLIVDLRPLTMLSSTLISLSLCDLPRAEYLLPTLEQLKLLRYLDISFFNEKA
ncbi:hypothetical protein NQ317_005797 [Molorchus minor]|uniref:Uncharacterized protein n=1 Tax=Molorchus minor TaxID=1323400 RepID=A0ABQ9JFY5_9CUCU|nr:hypothetical protein NQ317_005797 [Molorchus minor]